MWVRFAISSEGQVRYAEVVRSAVSDADTQQCVTGVIKAFRFPPSSGGVVANYPFVFSSLMPDG
jgi:hypothetical protein